MKPVIEHPLFSKPPAMVECNDIALLLHPPPTVVKLLFDWLNIPPPTVLLEPQARF